MRLIASARAGATDSTVSFGCETGTGTEIEIETGTETGIETGIEIGGDPFKSRVRPMDRAIEFTM